MPTVVSHSLVAIAFSEAFEKSKTLKFWTLSILCSIIPDIDVVMFGFGIPYQHMFGHRGFTHSVVFALIIAFFTVCFGYREIGKYTKKWWKYFCYFLILLLVHDLLDAMTSGGLGIGFFIPFDSTRYYLPFRPIRASPLSLTRLFDSEGKRVIVSEIVWVWIPTGALLLLSKLIGVLRRDKVKQER
jgi:inner membrane protein